MSTQFYTPGQQTPYQQPSNPQGGGRGSARIWIAALAAALVAVIVALCVVLTGSHSSTTPAASTSSSSAPATTSGGSSSGGSTHTVTPVQPSAAVETLQRQLGQLNYYEGPVDGLVGPQTIAAIKDLQRQANLPQTGVMNAATQNALTYYLAHGNNQMGGNS
jgi:peptidoglycan hydrolase-like protein with peptidoglycan-binding domain